MKAAATRDPGRRGGVRRLRLLIPACSFGVSFALMCWLIGETLPVADVPQVSTKLAHFAARHREFDTLFLGSSRTYRQLQPEVFDAVAEEHGVKSRAFNFGIDGMFAPEDGYVCDSILALQPRLRLVVIELSPFHADDATRALGSVRSIYWRDWARTRIIAEQLFGRREGEQGRPWWSDLPLAASRVGKFREYLQLALLQMTSFGRGANLLRQELHFTIAEDQTALLGPRGDGFKPLVREGGITGAKLAAFEKQIAERRSKPRKKLPLGAGGHANLQRMVSKLRAAGAEVVFVIAPSVQPQRVYPSPKLRVPIFDFSAVDAWPQFFEPALRHDPGHLNEAGSALYTRELAAAVFSSLPE